MVSEFSKLDMHTHSEYSSDSKLSLEKIGVFLKKHPDFGIILSDHNELSGALELQKS
jgi:predicted metal-dependent phosphoesterase TrpH